MASKYHGDRLADVDFGVAARDRPAIDPRPPCMDERHRFGAALGEAHKIKKFVEPQDASRFVQ